MNARPAPGLLLLLLLLGAAASACASAPPGRRHLRTPGRAVDAPFSDAVLVGNTLYLSGQLGLLPGTRQVPEDPAEEARLLLGYISEILQQAGMTLADLVSVQVFCPDVALYDTWNRVYGQLVPRPFPARAFIGSGPLLFGARFEMQAIAVRTENR